MIDFDPALLEKWQRCVNLLANVVGVPAGLIMRLTGEDIEVFVSSQTAGNPYKPGDREHFQDSGLYCEAVINRGQPLLVPDALSDPAWKNNPDIKLNMVSYLGHPILLPSGRPFGTICVLDDKPNPFSETYSNLVMEFRDIIEGELALGESEAKFRKLIEGSIQGILIHRDRKPLLINKAFAEILGFQSPEEISQSENLGQLIDEGEAVRKAAYLEAESKGGKPPNILVCKGRRKDGSIVWLETIVTVVDWEERPAVQIAAVDITERKRAEDALRESEEKFRSLVNQAVDAIYVLDTGGNFVDVNERACLNLGYSREELLKMSVKDVVVDHDTENRVRLYENIAPGEAHSTISMHRRKDGTTFPVEVHLGRIISGEKKLVLALARDITRRKELEAQVQKAQRMEAVGTLAGGIAHNFNNLLQVIMNNTSILLLQTDTNHPHHAILNEIKSRVNSGSSLTRQLLGFAGRGFFHAKSKNLNSLLATITNIFSHTHKEIKFDQEIEAELWNTNIDEAQIEQVLFNLFFNAKQAMPTGGSLSLRTENVTVGDNFGKIHEVTPGRFVKLSVTDTGVGMDQETQRRIFDPFFSTRGMTEGTGLGLASAYGIIRKHEGIITVESEIGRGTTFDIYLPALDREHVETAESATAEVRQGVGTILFVDDEEDLLNSSRRALERLGYDALVASSGAKALEIYRRNMGRVDLVILDMIMPEMGGGEVFDKLRELNPSVRVLLSSGYNLDGQAQEIMERGCDAFIQKPFDMETLSRKIDEVLMKE